MMRTIVQWKKAPLGISFYRFWCGVLALFVWYGPEMGLLSVGEGLELRLQNVFYLVVFVVPDHLLLFLSSG